MLFPSYYTQLMVMNTNAGLCNLREYMSFFPVNVPI